MFVLHPHDKLVELCDGLEVGGHARVAAAKEALQDILVSAAITHAACWKVPAAPQAVHSRGIVAKKSSEYQSRPYVCRLPHCLEG
jgi:hypothetical protein